MLNTVSVVRYVPNSRAFIAGVTVALLGWIAILLVLYLVLDEGAPSGLLSIGPILVVTGSLMACYNLEGVSSQARKWFRCCLFFFFVGFVASTIVVAKIIVDNEDSPAPEDDDSDRGPDFRGLGDALFYLFMILISALLLIYVVSFCLISSCCCPPVEYVEVHQEVVNEPPQETTYIFDKNSTLYTSDPSPV
eukprot:TRINITY_DN1061_c0_g2_i1.p1 TRINITY_DN1061_c0_g2~~TRINITY_DN1061_c0_g2_i1.p1  ORF type:complete len:192 (+),score=24.71 TRINITY_DN1061_c0_g2_i1:46-621(+)